ncbi:hypothetical protein N0V82_006869 [Gnomoniopsis sp. IMI 355080]|nr:hypothetical protein N0V82_006869 [Gnomoniopsis sp. IMI 355080]
MTTPNDTHKLARAPSAGLKTPQDEIPDTSSRDEKYNQLEDLLRQTLSLAGKIAEELSSQRLSRVSVTGVGHTQTPGEWIVLRKTSRRASEPTFQFLQQSSTAHQHRKYRPSYESEQESTSPSAGSSMQEPFSPGSLAMSLDAIVEGKKSDIPLVENSNSFADRLPESPPLTRATTSQTHASARSPTPGSTLAQDSMSQSAASAPIPIPGPPRSRPSASHRTSSPGLVRSFDDASSPPQKWHVRILPVSIDREPELSSSPPRTPTMPAFVKLEAVFPYRFFSDRHAAARWSGEGSYIVIGKLPVQDEEQSSLGLDERGNECGSTAERSLRDYIENWEDNMNELGATEERKSFHAE